MPSRLPRWPATARPLTPAEYERARRLLTWTPPMRHFVDRDQTGTIRMCGMSTDFRFDYPGPPHFQAAEAESLVYGPAPSAAAGGP